tara:strand:- start:210 stop:401 length:192 start_codon:yes stop_codon:yes gene_type:complete
MAQPVATMKKIVGDAVEKGTSSADDVGGRVTPTTIQTWGANFAKRATAAVSTMIAVHAMVRAN